MSSALSSQSLYLNIGTTFSKSQEKTPLKSHKILSEELPQIRPLERLTFPKFPKLHELADQEQTAGSPRTADLFEMLLQSKAEPLYYDYLDRPGEYDASLAEVLPRLINGGTPTALERKLLSEAMVTFASAKKAPPKEAPKMPSTPKLEEGSEMELEPFWWLR